MAIIIQRNMKTLIYLRKFVWIDRGEIDTIRIRNYRYCTVYNVHCILSIMYSIQCTVYNVHIQKKHPWYLLFTLYNNCENKFILILESIVIVF